VMHGVLPSSLTAADVSIIATATLNSVRVFKEPGSWPFLFGRGCAADFYDDDGPGPKAAALERNCRLKWMPTDGHLKGSTRAHIDKQILLYVENFVSAAQTFFEAPARLSVEKRVERMAPALLRAVDAAKELEGKAVEAAHGPKVAARFFARHRASRCTSYSFERVKSKMFFGAKEQ
jgi:hypothetical protein